MSWQKLTPAIKKRITHDWQALFPSLGVYKPMHLLNRAGPLLVGILLEVKSGNHNYIPTFHVHNLTRPFPVISLSLATTLNREYVHVEWHTSKYQKLAKRMKEIAFIPFEGDLELHRVLEGYKQYLEQPVIPYQMYDYEDMVLLSAWCGNTREAQACMEFTKQHMKRWPPHVLERIGDIDTWMRKFEEQSNDTEALKITCEQQIATLKVGKLPVRKLLS